VCLVAIGVAYSVWLLGTRGHTVRMMAVGIRLIDEPQGSAPTIGQVGRRAFIGFVLLTVWSEAALLRSL
jgi:hypothetical protein